MFITSAGGSASTDKGSTKANAAARMPLDLFIGFPSDGKPANATRFLGPRAEALVAALRVDLPGGLVVLVAGVRRPAVRVEEAERGLILLADRVQGAEPLQEAAEVRQAVGIAAGARVGGGKRRTGEHARHPLRDQREDACEVGCVHVRPDC